MLEYKERSIIEPATPNHFGAVVTFPTTNPDGSERWEPPLALSGTLPFSTPSYRSAYERLLSDDTGPRNQWKPCEHYKRYTRYAVETDGFGFNWTSLSGTGLGTYVAKFAANPLLVVDDNSFSSTFGAFGDHIKDLPSLTTDRPDGGFVPPPDDLDSLVQASLKSIMPEIRAELSAINSVIELKDFGSLPTTLRDIAKFVSNLGSLRSSLGKQTVRSVSNYASAVRRTFSSSQGGTLRELLRLSADSYLQLQFGILPTTRDIIGIANAVANTEKKLRVLLEREGRRRIKHYVFKRYLGDYSGYNRETSYALNEGQFFGSTTSEGSTGFNYALYPGINVQRYTLIQEPAIFHAQIEYNYMFTQFQREHARMLAFLDSLGVNLNPAIIWNAIPWSFLVDWLIGVSRWLDDRKVLNLEPTVNITRYLWSHKVTRRTRCVFKTYQSGSGVASVPPSYLPDLYESSYRRDVGLPSKDSLLTASGLSSRELSLGVALALTRKRHPRTRA